MASKADGLSQMVLDAGKLVSEGTISMDLFSFEFQVEFDSAQNLLRKKGSMLKSLVDESRDREKLYKMAGRTGK